MTFLCVVVLLSLLAYDFGEAAYPPDYAIEKSILGFISENKKTSLCGVALITNLYGIAPSDCVKGIDLSKTKTYAVINKGRSPKAVYDVLQIRNEEARGLEDKYTSLAIIFVKDRNEQLLCLIHGLVRPNNIELFEPSKIEEIKAELSSLVVYGLKRDNQAHGFAVQEIVFSPDESFTLRLDSNHQDVNFIGASVIYKRNFVAMCDAQSETELVLYCKLTSNIVGTILNLQKGNIKFGTGNTIVEKLPLPSGLEIASSLLETLSKSNDNINFRAAPEKKPSSSCNNCLFRRSNTHMSGMLHYQNID